MNTFTWKNIMYAFEPNIYFACKNQYIIFFSSNICTNRNCTWSNLINQTDIIKHKIICLGWNGDSMLIPILMSGSVVLFIIWHQIILSYYWTCFASNYSISFEFPILLQYIDVKWCNSKQTIKSQLMGGVVHGNKCLSKTTNKWHWKKSMRWHILYHLTDRNGAKTNVPPIIFLMTC